MRGRREAQDGEPAAFRGISPFGEVLDMWRLRPLDVLAAAPGKRGTPATRNFKWRGTFFGASRLWCTKDRCAQSDVLKTPGTNTPNATPLRLGSATLLNLSPITSHFSLLTRRQRRRNFFQAPSLGLDPEKQLCHSGSDHQ